MASTFTRQASPQLLSELQIKKLFKQKLREDCINENLFMAVRKNVIHFYHKGGRLFEFDPGLKWKKRQSCPPSAGILCPPILTKNNKELSFANRQSLKICHFH